MRSLGSRSPCTGEFVHPNMIYFMNIHANMRRLSVGAALSEAGSQYSAQHWSRSLESPLRAAVCKPKTLFETSHVAVAFSSSNDGAVLPFARAALYQDGRVCSLYHQVIFINHAHLFIFSGCNEQTPVASTLGRHSTFFAGRNQERSKLGTAGYSHARVVPLAPG